MAGEGIPYRADTGGGVGATPDLRAPLGPPPILRPEDFVAMANFNDPTVALKNAADLTSSLIDNHYKNQIDLAKSAADLSETAARTGYYGAYTDNIQSESDQRKQLMPLAVQQQALKLKTDQNAFDTAKAQQADYSDALDRAKEAMTSLPRYDDPDYQNKINTWLNDNAHLLSRPDDVGKQLQTAYGLVDGRVKATSQFQQKLGQVQEFNQLQAGGYINSPANADAQVFGGTAEPTLVHGRMAKNLDQLQQLISDPRTPQAQRDQLNGLYNYGNSFLGSDTGAADVMANKAKTLFDTSGNFNGTAKGIVNGVSAMLGKETKPAEYETTIPIPGVPGPKAGEKATETIKGTQEQVRAALTDYEAQAERQKTAEAIKAGIPDTPENLADVAAYQRGEFGPDPQAAKAELARRVNARAVPPARPAPVPAPTPAPTPGATPQLPMSNNDYQFPAGASNHAGIDHNVWANVMSEEGREFGKDGSHDSVFGLWADQPGVEGQAYQAVKDNGPNSLAAYNAVTNAWTNKFLRESQPWNLQAPGLQEMVIADSQHQGGAAARAIINQMGGFAKVNAMPADQAIRQYSELRKPLWPGNNRPFPNGASDRVTRERAWALTHNDRLLGG